MIAFMQRSPAFSCSRSKCNKTQTLPLSMSSNGPARTHVMSKSRFFSSVLSMGQWSVRSVSKSQRKIVYTEVFIMRY